MRFSEVIGQDEIKEKLLQAYHSNRISHAYLFYGQAGIGKLALALSFAQFLSCEHKTQDDSCGICSSCVKYQKLVHPDLHFVFPIVSIPNKKSISDNFISQWREQILQTSAYMSYNEWITSISAESKQGNIYAEESNEILRKLNLKSYESQYKIMIIWLPEKMNIACSNKLLKILEEPPQETIFILVTNNREEVLPTIVSRTQPVKILGIETDKLKTYLESKYNIEPEIAEDISIISNGSYSEAKEQILASEDNRYNLNQFIDFMKICYTRDNIEAIKWSAEIAKIGREKQKFFLYYSLIMIRENFVLNFNEQKILQMTKEEMKFAVKFSKLINVNNVSELTEEFNLAYQHIERNGSAKIIFTDLAFKIMELIRKK